MFGYASRNGEYQNDEWGYSEYSGLKKSTIKGFEGDRDMNREPQKAGGIEKIVESGGVSY